VSSLVREHLPEIVAACERYGIRRLELFGSASGDGFDPSRSDVDLFYEFVSDFPDSVADRFFDFLEFLEEILGCAVDLVSAKDVHNPYFLQVANRSRVTLYDAANAEVSA
jgi:predicted nucleotidyltransferase